MNELKRCLSSIWNHGADAFNEWDHSHPGKDYGIRLAILLFLAFLYAVGATLVWAAHAFCSYFPRAAEFLRHIGHGIGRLAAAAANSKIALLIKAGVDWLSALPTWVQITAPFLIGCGLVVLAFTVGTVRPWLKAHGFGLFVSSGIMSYLLTGLSFDQSWPAWILASMWCWTAALGLSRMDEPTKRVVDMEAVEALRRGPQVFGTARPANETDLTKAGLL